MSLPKLSIRLHGGMTAQACVEQACAAEAAGIGAVWFAENPFARGVMTAATACELAVGSAPAEGRLAPRLIRPEEVGEEVEVMDRVGLCHPNIDARPLETGESTGGVADPADASRPESRAQRGRHRMEAEDVSDLERASRRLAGPSSRDGKGNPGGRD